MLAPGLGEGGEIRLFEKGKGNGNEKKGKGWVELNLIRKYTNPAKKCTNLCMT